MRKPAGRGTTPVGIQCSWFPASEGRPHQGGRGCLGKWRQGPYCAFCWKRWPGRPRLASLSHFNGLWEVGALPDWLALGWLGQVRSGLKWESPGEKMGPGGSVSSHRDSGLCTPVRDCLLYRSKATNIRSSEMQKEKGMTNPETNSMLASDVSSSVLSPSSLLFSFILSVPWIAMGHGRQNLSKLWYCPL